MRQDSVRIISEQLISFYFPYAFHYIYNILLSATYNQIKTSIETDAKVSASKISIFSRLQELKAMELAWHQT